MEHEGRSRVASFDDRQHVAFDRYLHPHRPNRIPTTTKRRATYALRTAFTSAICLVASNYYNWGGLGTYISPILSAISAALSLGQWQVTFVQVTYGTLFGSTIGTAIGFTYHILPLQLICIFVALVWSNRISWEQTSKVYAGLTIVLCGFWPNISKGLLLGSTALKSVLAIVFIPNLITFCTLLLPVPTLAVEAAKLKTGTICREISALTIVAVRGFCAQDFHDMYSADFEHLYRDAIEGTEVLKMLVMHAEQESLLIPWIEDQVFRLKSFLPLAVKLLQELFGLREMLKIIKNNHTQAKFVENLASHLEDVAAEVAVGLRLVCEHLTEFSTPQSEVLGLPRRLYEFVTCSKIVEETPYTTTSSGEAPSDSYATGASPTTAGEGRRSTTRNRSGSLLGSAWLWDKSVTLIERRLNELSARRSSKTHVHMSTRFSSSAEPPLPINMNVSENESSSKQQQQSHPLQLSIPGSDNVIEVVVQDDIEDDGFAVRQGARWQPLTMAPSVPTRLELFIATTKRLQDAKQQLVDGFMLTRRVYLWQRPPQFTPSPSHVSLEGLIANETVQGHQHQHRRHHQQQQYHQLHSNESHQSAHANGDEQYDHHADNHELDSEAKPFLSSQPAQDDDGVGGLSSSDEVLLNGGKSTNKGISFSEFKVLLEENHTMRNLNPRGAYIHRLSEIARIVSSLDALFVATVPTPWPQSLTAYYTHVGMYLWTYVISSFSSFWSTAGYVSLKVSLFVVSLVARLRSCHGAWPTLISDADMQSLAVMRKAYVQGYKVAAAVVVASVLVVVPSLADTNQNGFWAVIVITLIRQEQTSSSFLVGYQRIEGTVMGAVYAFTAYQALNCGNVTCSESVIVPVLIIWLLLCSFFREGPRHGYAALVAGYTPIALLAGPSASTKDIAWQRVQKTFIGVALYLFIDNVILPNRTDSAIRQGLVQSLDETIKMFQNVILSVKTLVDMGDPHHHHLNDNQLFPGSESFSMLTPMNQEGTSTTVATNRRPQWASHTRSKSLTQLDKDVQSLAIYDHYREETVAALTNNPAVKHANSDITIIIGAASVPSSAATIPSHISNTSASTKRVLEHAAKLHHVLDPFEKSERFLKAAEENIAKLAAVVTTQINNLKVVIHEPELWQRPFPVASYQEVYKRFSELVQAGRSVYSASLGLRHALAEMHDHDKDDKNIMKNLYFYEFMSQRIFAVVSRTSTALHMTSVALHRLYEHNDLRTDLTPLITLSRYFQRLLHEVDQHFKELFAQIGAPPDLDPNFILAWQNTFESLCDLVKSLSALGMALHAVKSVEALSAV